MFTPFKLREMTVPNRVVVSPMDMYTAHDGTPNDFHLVHLGSRALGGAGLIVTEMTCVSPEGRISLGCTGMYTPAHVPEWKRVVDFVHQHSPAKICLQLGHSGRKGSTKLPWEGGGADEALKNGWEVIAPSAIPHAPKMPMPREMTRATWRKCATISSARPAWPRCGFDMLELHCAHGYLLSSFITPLK